MGIRGIKIDKNQIRKHRLLLLGLACMLFVSGVFAVYAISVDRQEMLTEVGNADMARESNISALKDPAEIVEYLLYACQNQDLDQWLRGCAIQERTNHFSLTEYLRQTEAFSVTETPAPSGKYSEYRPVQMLELTEAYGEAFSVFCERLGGNTAFEILQVGYDNPESQLSPDVYSETYRQCDIWGAEYLADMIALLERNGELYAVTFQVGRYGEDWKLFSVDITLSATSQEAYASRLGSEESRVAMQTLCVKVTEEELDQETEETEETEEVLEASSLLPLNYSLYGQAYEDTPEMLIRQFMYCIRRKNVSAALCYGQKDSLEGSDVLTCVASQKTFAQELKQTYYSIAFRELEPEVTSQSNAEVFRNLQAYFSPNSFQWLRYHADNCEVVYAGQDGSLEYLVYFQLNGEHMILPVTVAPSEAGWQIQSLSAEHSGYGIGDVK